MLQSLPTREMINWPQSGRCGEENFYSFSRIDHGFSYTLC